MIHGLITRLKTNDRFGRTHLGLDSTWHAQIEHGAYFKLSKFDSVKIIWSVNVLSILRKMLLARVIRSWKLSEEYVTKAIQLSENSSQETYLVTYLVSQTKCNKSAFIQMCITFV